MVLPAKFVLVQGSDVGSTQEAQEGRSQMGQPTAFGPGGADLGSFGSEPAGPSPEKRLVCWWGKNRSLVLRMRNGVNLFKHSPIASFEGIPRFIPKPLGPPAK